MAVVRGGVLRLGLGARQRALAVAQCRKDLAKRSVLRAACEDTIAADTLRRGTVRIDSFLMDRLEVSQRHYSTCRNEKACPRLRLRWRMKSQPAAGVTWKAAAAYCDWRGKRLPTEDEWLYAARGHDDGRLYPWGDEPPVVDDRHKANYGRMGKVRPIGSRSDGHKYAGPVGVFGVRVPGPFGLANLAGNVREWTYTLADGGHVVRGGGWRDMAHGLRATRRQVVKDTAFAADLGFRCARDIPAE